VTSFRSCAQLPDVTFHQGAEPSGLSGVLSVVPPAIGSAGSGAGPSGGRSPAGAQAALFAFESDVFCTQMFTQPVLQSPGFILPPAPARSGSNWFGLTLC
jgi:hypothetical protein